MPNANTTEHHNPSATAAAYAVEEMDPAAEYAYWRDHFANRPDVDDGAIFDDYAPAYVFGIHASAKFPDRGFEEVESDLALEWPTVRGDSNLEWEHARDATRDSWVHSRRDLEVVLLTDAVSAD